MAKPNYEAPLVVHITEDADFFYTKKIHIR